jgi:hypothetical protein
MIGGTSPDGASWLREQIREARSRTSRPFGVGFISPFPDTEELVRVALDEGVAAINHSFADPTPFVASAHAAGVKVFVQVQTLNRDVRVAAGRRRGARCLPADRLLPDQVSPGDLLLLDVATHKMSRLLAKDWVTSFYRASFTEYQGRASLRVK